MDNETIKKILDLAVLAPSGDNCQPWRFEVRDGKLLTFIVPEKDVSRNSSFFSHGAMLENLAISAPAFGWLPKIRFFDEPGKSNLTTEIRFEKISAYEDPLFPFIRLRASNRKPYEETPLAEDELADISDSFHETEKGKIIFLHEKNKKEKAAKILGGNMNVLFSVRVLHDFFYNHIKWTARDDADLLSGFPIETLEIPKNGLPLFKLLGSWGVASISRFFHIPSLLASSTSKVFSRAAAFGVIVSPDNETRSILDAGRILERVWLKAARYGLQFHVFGIPSLLLDKQETLSEKNFRLVKSIDSELLELCGLKNGSIMLVFRLGKGQSPSSRTKRLPPEISFY